MSHKSTIISPTEDWVSDALKDAPPIMRVGEVATLLRCCERQIRRYASTGHLTPIKVVDRGSSRLNFARYEVARFLRTLDERAVV